MNQKPLVAAAAIIAALAIALLVRRATIDKRAKETAVDTVGAQPPAQVAPPVASIDSTPATGSKPPVTSAPSAAPGDTAPRSNPAASQGQAANALKQAAAAYAGIRSLRADFVQRSDNPLLGRQTTSRGTVMQRQPDRF